jgi:metal-sulfur cluster biosynthetic enzyme
VTTDIDIREALRHVVDPEIGVNIMSDEARRQLGEGER